MLLNERRRRLLAGLGALEDRLLERARPAAVADRRAGDAARTERVHERVGGLPAEREHERPDVAGQRLGLVCPERAQHGAAGRVGELSVVQDRDAEPLEAREVEDALVLVDVLARRAVRRPRATRARRRPRASRPRRGRSQPPPQSATSTGPRHALGRADGIPGVDHLDAGRGGDREVCARRAPVATITRSAPAASGESPSMRVPRRTSTPRRAARRRAQSAW